MDNDHEAHEIAHTILWDGIKDSLPLKTQIEKLVEDNSADIEPDFLGFLGTYYYLSHIIPHDRIIYDMGCAYGIQAWFFRNHKKYIGVDVLTTSFFIQPNAECHTMTIKDFLAQHGIESPHFAICNYVPHWYDDNEKIVRDNFRHLFVFYPEGGDDGLSGKMEEL